MELYIGRQHGEIGLEDAVLLMERYPQYVQRAVSSAIRYESFRMKNIVKQTIREGGPGGSWLRLNPHTGVLNRAAKGWIKNYRKSRKGIKKGEEAKRVYKKHMVSTRTLPLQKLAGGTRYYFDKGVMAATIGFLSGRSPGATTILAKKHAMGFRVPVTAKSRRWAFALGFPLKQETAELIIPSRPVVGPVFEQEKGKIAKNINTKVMSNIHCYATGGSKS